MLRKKIAVKSTDEQCCICLNKLNTAKYCVQIECKHKFHFPCLKAWHKKEAKNHQVATCPLCRKKIQFQFQFYHHVKPFSNSSYNNAMFPSYFNAVLKEMDYFFRCCPIKYDTHYYENFEYKDECAVFLPHSKSFEYAADEIWYAIHVKKWFRRDRRRVVSSLIR